MGRVAIKALADSNRSLIHRLQVHYFLLFAPFAIALTYQNLYFQRIGFNKAQIGLLNAIAAVLTVVSPPLWGVFADKVREKRFPLATLLFTSGVTYPLFLLVHSFAAVAVFQAIFNFFMAPCIALTDAITLSHLKRIGGDYGKVRLWGSLGFICTLTVFGMFLGGGPLAHAAASGNLTTTFFTFTLFRCLGVFWVYRLPNTEAAPMKKENGGKEGIRSLLGNNAFLLFLLVTFLGQSALKSYYVFFSIYLDGLHVPDSMKGVFWSLGVASEVVFMVYAGRLLRILGVRRMLALGMAGGALRLILFSFALPLSVVGGAQSLHALAFAATHIASMAFISTSVPESMGASGQTIYTAVQGGIAGVVGSSLCGYLAERYDIPHSFELCATLAVLAVILALFLPERRLKATAER